MSEIGELTRKDKEWQETRQKLLGQWKVNPEWCCQQLRQYLGNIRDTSNDKVKIVMNYLTGTGFRTGRIKHECISKLRGELSAEIRKRKMSGSW